MDSVGVISGDLGCSRVISDRVRRRKDAVADADKAPEADDDQCHGEVLAEEGTAGSAVSQLIL